jgi:glycosyltransferase involved in cell wall biosynthesis
MLQKPKLSIVTPSYNKGRYIEKTIKSVLFQDYDNFEYIVIDGGSTDNTIEILKKYDKLISSSRVFRWISEKDNGQTDAINKGLKLCNGEWFAFINADDFYSPNLFADLAEFLSRNKDAGVVYGNQYDLYESNEYRSTILKKPESGITFNDLLYCNKIYGPASFYNMEALKRVGGFDAGIYHWMDWEMFLRIAKIMPLKYFDYNFTTFRISEEMKSPSNPDNKKAYKRFQKEAHMVSVRFGGKYFSEKWLQRFPAYGKYKYYLRRYEKEPGVIRHDKLENAKISRTYMALAVTIHYLLKPLLFILKKQ